MPSPNRTRSVSASVKAGGKTITVQASAPINVEPKPTRATRRDPEQRRNNPNVPQKRVPVSSVTEDILAMGNSIIAVESPNLRVFDLTIGYRPTIDRSNSTAFNILQSVLQEKVGVVYETVTLVIRDASLPIAETSKPSMEALGDVVVLWGAPQDSSFEYAEPDTVPADLKAAARFTAQCFVESLDGLVSIDSLDLHEVKRQRLVYSI
jgi:hypothetical protein